jgi:hypothetical protein
MVELDKIAFTDEDKRASPLDVKNAIVNALESEGYENFEVFCKPLKSHYRITIQANKSFKFGGVASSDIGRLNFIPRLNTFVISYIDESGSKDVDLDTHFEIYMGGRWYEVSIKAEWDGSLYLTRFNVSPLCYLGCIIQLK